MNCSDACKPHARSHHTCSHTHHTAACGVMLRCLLPHTAAQRLFLPMLVDVKYCRTLATAAHVQLPHACCCHAYVAATHTCLPPCSLTYSLSSLHYLMHCCLVRLLLPYARGCCHVLAVTLSLLDHASYCHTCWLAVTHSLPAHACMHGYCVYSLLHYACCCHTTGVSTADGTVF